MDKVNRIEMQFIFKKRCHSLETDRLRKERNHPELLRIVGRGRENGQEHRPSQEGRKQVEKLNIEIYHIFFNYSETLGTTPLQEYQQNNHESWLNSSDGESQVSHQQHEKCPTSVLNKFKKHQSVNLIRLKQTAKRNTMELERKEKTAEAIQRTSR